MVFVHDVGGYGIRCAYLVLFPCVVRISKDRKSISACACINTPNNNDLVNTSYVRT